MVLSLLIFWLGGLGGGVGGGKNAGLNGVVWMVVAIG